GLKRRTDVRADVLRAVCRVEQKLRERVNLLFGVEEECADSCAERRATRLARRDDLAALQSQVAGEHTHLRGLPAPVNALEGDKGGGQIFYVLRVGRREGSSSAVCAARRLAA